MRGIEYNTQAWLYERVPRLGKPNGSTSVPRILRWGDCHGKLDACQRQLRETGPGHVVQFVPLSKEKKYYKAARSIPAVSTMLKSCVLVCARIDNVRYVLMEKE